MKTCTKCESELPETEFSKHPLGRGGLRPSCRTCDNAVRRNWREKNKEAHSNYNKLWAKNNREKQRAAAKVCRDRRKEHYSKTKRAAYHKKRDARLATRRLWTEKNREQVTFQQRLRKARRLLRERTSIGSYTGEEIRALYKKQNGECVYCGCQLGKNFHRDHRMPLVLGGSCDIGNIQLTCPACNYAKGTKHPDSFRRLVGPRATALELS